MARVTGTTPSERPNFAAKREGAAFDPEAKTGTRPVTIIPESGCIAPSTKR